MSSEPLPDKNERRPSLRSTVLVRVIGLILVAAAVYLYFCSDKPAAQRRAYAAAMVSRIAAGAVPAVGVRASLEPGATNEQARLYEPCSASVASNILDRLTKAEPAEIDVRAKFDESYDLYLVLTNHSSVAMHARRNSGSDDVFVSLSERRHQQAGSDGGTVDSLPALVTGLGAIFDEISRGEFTDLREVRRGPAAVQSISITNLPRRVGFHGFTEEAVGDTAAGLALVSGFNLRGIALPPTDKRAPLAFLTPDLAEKVVAALAAAENSEPPAECSVDVFDIVLVLDDGYAVQLRVMRPEDAPADAYVGFVELDETGDAPKLKVSPLAFSEGLGALLPPKRAPARAEEAPAENAAAPVAE